MITSFCIGYTNIVSYFVKTLSFLHLLRCCNVNCIRLTCEHFNLITEYSLLSVRIFHRRTKCHQVDHPSCPGAENLREGVQKHHKQTSLWLHFNIRPQRRLSDLTWRGWAHNGKLRWWLDNNPKTWGRFHQLQSKLERLFQRLRLGHRRTLARQQELTRSDQRQLYKTANTHERHLRQELGGWLQWLQGGRLRHGFQADCRRVQRECERRPGLSEPDGIFNNR